MTFSVFIFFSHFSIRLRAGSVRLCVELDPLQSFQREVVGHDSVAIHDLTGRAQRGSELGLDSHAQLARPDASRRSDSSVARKFLQSHVHERRASVSQQRQDFVVVPRCTSAPCRRAVWLSFPEPGPRMRALVARLQRARELRIARVLRHARRGFFLRRCHGRPRFTSQGRDSIDSNQRRIELRRYKIFRWI